MRLKNLLVGGTCAAVVAGSVLVASATGSSGATPTAGEGIECEPGNGAWALSTATGRISMPDGNTLFSWGFKTNRRTFQLPGPVLCVKQGQTVTITLTNTLSEDTSLIFPGQSGVLADGVPSAPVSDSGGRITSLAPIAPAQIGTTPGTITYSFVASKPGTFLYESGTDTAKQVEMGLYGAIIVRPAESDYQAYADPRTAFEPAREFLHILSEVDPDLHLAVERNQPFDWSTYKAKYFLLNGRSAPDTVSPNDAAWLPSQPYGSMVRVRPYKASGGDAQPALVRYINVMGEDAAFHPHGNTERVIAQDASPLDQVDKPDASYGKFLVDIGSNRTADALFTWTDDEGYNPTTNPVPVTVPGYQDLIIKGTWYSMSPYLGFSGQLPAGQASFNQCGEYYHMAHNHNLSKATNFGVSFGGQMTLIRIDPAGGCK